MSNIEHINNSYLQNITKYLDGKNYYETFIQNDKEKLAELKKRVKKYIDIPLNTSKDSILNYIYAFVSENYRNDIVFKIELLENLELFIDRITDAFIVNEFKTGRCVTDIAIFNGKSISFEIKSDLDRASNLNTQLNQFSKVFDKNYLITNEERVCKFSKQISENCGLISVDSNLNFELVKEAKTNENLSFDLLFKILRKDEYLDLVVKYFGEIPNVPNTRIYSECFRMLSGVDFNEFRGDFIEKMKKRSYSVSFNELTGIDKIKRQGYLANSKF